MNVYRYERSLLSILDSDIKMAERHMFSFGDLDFNLTADILRACSTILDEVPLSCYPVLYFHDYKKYITLGDQDNNDDDKRTYKHYPWVHINGKPNGYIVEINIDKNGSIIVEVYDDKFLFNYYRTWDYKTINCRIIKFDSKTCKFKLYVPKEIPRNLVECVKTELATWPYLHGIGEDSYKEEVENI